MAHPSIPTQVAKDGMTPKREARQRPASAAPLPIAAVAAFMALAATTINVLPATALPRISWSFIMWAGILALAFWLVETVPIHLEWAGQAYSMSLSEVPLVLGLFFCPTSMLVAARVIGGGIALALSRNSRRTSSRSTLPCNPSKSALRSQSSPGCTAPRAAYPWTGRPWRWLR